MPGIYKNILVAIDGSKESEAALSEGIEMAKENQASLILVTVIDTTRVARAKKYRDLLTRNIDEINKRMDAYRKQAEAQNIKNVEVIIEKGSPKKLIPIDIAKRVNADLIICGATGMTPAEQIFLGSVTQQIVTNAECDVLVKRISEE
ncbi:universal stress protein [Ureibacillus sp. FSL K6-8385]|uniref:Universal stress protein n=1 Tax=Ureibacillus terrenus TaxID=118246 RepID=A0A540V396_9BACL|nr:universal stress protein [Ureibacillus terrenus]MED3662711.1 universal stress protein [Ureibacillus terrenus]MED3763657.1 universal stress protein [Ureibacillus terrenus]TQE91209.1 universal stress protein [Ureibacillus terrenus]